MLISNYGKNIIEVGCDEAGRGCLAGPVFAAAVILPTNFKYAGIKDSKKLSIHDRKKARKIILENSISWAVAKVDVKQIDKINILCASILAMKKAIGKLSVRPDLALIDGNRFDKHFHIPHKCIIRGDGIYQSIAAASILAKTSRDEHMLKLSSLYPHYKWDCNKGYPTLAHRNAIDLHGISRHHRVSFKLSFQQLKLPLSSE